MSKQTNIEISELLSCYASCDKERPFIKENNRMWLALALFKWGNTQEHRDKVFAFWDSLQFTEPPNNIPWNSRGFWAYARFKRWKEQQQK